MKDNLDLSIIIPAYNAGKYIEECLKSVLKETNFSYEVIVINDGSTDNTKDIIERINDQRITLYNNENHGVSYSRNYGINKAKGKYIMFVDADDMLADGWQEKIENELRKDNNLIIFSASNEITKIDGRDKFRLANLILCIEQNNCYLSSPWSKLYDSSIIKNNKILFDEDTIYGEDMLFVLDIALLDIKISFINSSIYLYNQNQESISHSYEKKIAVTKNGYHNKLVERLEKCKELNKKEVTTIVDGCYNNSYFNILRNASYCNKYRNFCKSIQNLKNEYRVGDYKKNKGKRRVVLFLYEIKCYVLVFALCKIKNKKKKKEIIVV